MIGRGWHHRRMRPTLHLVPAADWNARPAGTTYAHPSLATEGFIHCTDGDGELLATGDRYYREDGRPYVVLTIDLDAVGVPWRIDDPAGRYPHVYGAIPTAAIVAVRSVRRAADGRFVAIDDDAGDP